MRTIAFVRCLMFALATMSLVAAAPSMAQVSVAITVAPPDLPVYDQPVCPSEGYIWTPGYWAWDDEVGYYWVPGTWVLAPEPGLFWTPGYWAWGGDAFVFHEGYWGPEVGFYGGVDYGFGYFGHGYEGGRWDNGRFFYNRAVNNVNVTVVQNVYTTEVVNNTTVNRVSFNGGNGGINARPTSQEEAAARGRHAGPVAAQTQHVQAARSNQQLRASVNNGKPPVAATAKPGAFQGGTVAAKQGGQVHGNPGGRGAAGTQGSATRNEPTRNQSESTRNQPEPTRNEPERKTNGGNARAAVHPNELPPAERPAPPSTGDVKHDQRYQQQQEKLQAQQNQERQKLQAKQDQEHQQLSKANADDPRKQQVEQKHQQQTQQLTQKHEQQQQHLQQKQQPAHTAQKPPENEKPPHNN